MGSLIPREIYGGYAPFHKRFLSFWFVSLVFQLFEVARTYVGPSHTSTGVLPLQITMITSHERTASTKKKYK